MNAQQKRQFHAGLEYLYLQFAELDHAKKTVKEKPVKKPIHKWEDFSKELKK